MRSPPARLIAPYRSFSGLRGHAPPALRCVPMWRPAIGSAPACGDASAASWSLSEVADHTRRIAGHDAARGDVAHDDAPGAHGRIVADANALQHDHARRQPDTVLQYHRRGRRQPIAVVNIVIVVVVDDRILADQTIASDRYQFVRRDGDTVVDRRVVADGDLAARPGDKLDRHRCAADANAL